MGIFSSALSGALAASSEKKLRIPKKIFGGIDMRSNTLICGAPAGGLSYDRAHRLMHHRFDRHVSRNENAVYITSDIDEAYALYQYYGDDITVYGHNRRFDPFEFCATYNDASFLLGAMTGDAHENAYLRSWTDIIVTLMEMSGSPLTYGSFDSISDFLFTSADADDFAQQVSGLGLTVSSSLRASLFRLWHNLCGYQQYINKLSRQLEYLQEPAVQQNARRQLVFYVPAADSELVLSSVFAGLLLYCRRYTDRFSLMCDNIELKKEAADLIGRFRVPFFIYAPVLSSDNACRNTLLAELFTFVCFSGVSAEDTARIISSFSSQANAWLPALNPFGFGVHRGQLPTLTADSFLRLREGQAMIYDKNRRRFVQCANCI